jgi:hypothetical protein
VVVVLAQLALGSVGSIKIWKTEILDNFQNLIIITKKQSQKAKVKIIEILWYEFLNYNKLIIVIINKF